jgi:hypothetical protein
MNTAAPRVVAEALLFACVLPGAVFLVLSLNLGLALFVFAVAVAHASVLGIPAYLFLRWRKWANVFTSVAGGFAAACLPVALLLFPGDGRFVGSSAWSGGVQTSVNGVPTAQGWQSYWDTVLLFGGCGALVGLAFWGYVCFRVRRAT